MDSLKTAEFGCERSHIRLQVYSIDASVISSRNSSDNSVPAVAARRLKSDQRTQMSDPMAARQPFQPVGDAGDGSALHAISTTRSETVLTARSGGTIGLRLK